MVTGASGVIGRALVGRLVEVDEVRACIRGPGAAEQLRAMGAKVALGRLDDADALAEVLQRVFTVFHLAGGPLQTDDEAVLEANAGLTARVVEAARAAGVRRVIVLSVPGADPDSEDVFLRAKGLAERAVTSSGLDNAVVRCTHAYGVGGLWFTAAVQVALADPPRSIGTRGLAPVLADDVAAILAAVDDRSGALEGTWAVEGPDAVEPAELTAMLRGVPASSVGALERPAEQLEELLGAELPPVVVRHLLRPYRADAPDAASRFGTGRTALVAGLGTTLELLAAHRPPAG
jgi:uncharacterized protein YbjT (DUF2867 family)